MRVGLISDTHGLLRPEALDFLAGADHIVHGGDIGGPEILERLAAIAPLTVVRGNNDTAPWARAIPEAARVDVGAVVLYVNPGSAGPRRFSLPISAAELVIGAAGVRARLVTLIP
jgi:predicted phosphodiesterase